MNRRNILINTGRLGLLLGAAGALQPWLARPASAEEIGADERILGAADAPITIIEYASMTCPHCATFHANSYKDLKSDWVDSGKARFVFRHFPLDGLALRASALAECLQGNAFFGFIDLLFATQQSWARSSDPIGALQELAKQAGMDEEKSGTCLEDEVAITRILEQRQYAADELSVNSTPSFIINGEKFAGASDYSEFDSFLKGLL